MAGGLFYDTKRLEALHINFFARDIELFVGFFTSGVGTKVHDRVLRK